MSGRINAVFAPEPSLCRISKPLEAYRIEEGMFKALDEGAWRFFGFQAQQKRPQPFGSRPPPR